MTRQERVALTLSELCEGSSRASLPVAVHDHLRASGASSVLPVLSMLGLPSESIRISALRIIGALLGRSPSAGSKPSSAAALPGAPTSKPPTSKKGEKKVDEFTRAFYQLHVRQLVSILIYSCGSSLLVPVCAAHPRDRCVVL